MLKSLWPRLRKKNLLKISCGCGTIIRKKLILNSPFQKNFSTKSLKSINLSKKMDKSIWTWKSTNAIVNKYKKLANFASPKKQLNSSQNSQIVNFTFHYLISKKSNEKRKSLSKIASMSEPKLAKLSSDSFKTVPKSNKYSKIPCKLEVLPNLLLKKGLKFNSLMDKK